MSQAEKCGKGLTTGERSGLAPFKDLQVLWEPGTQTGSEGGLDNVAEEQSLRPSGAPPATCLKGILRMNGAQTSWRRGQLRQHRPKSQRRTLRASLGKGPPRATLSESAVAQILSLSWCHPCPLDLPSLPGPLLETLS